jgi:phosphodiesterase/alkaline phosphatase D-like protein
LAAQNELGVDHGEAATFITGAVEPSLEGAPAASEITRSSALIQASLDPEHSQTSYHVEYVEAAGYEPAGSDPYAAGESSAAANAGTEFGSVAIEQLLGGLKPDTSYHYRVVAVNQAGRAVGADATFTTGEPVPPEATTGGATNVSQNTATIAGTVDTEGQPSTYGFEIGTEAGRYGSPVGLGSVGAGASEATVTLDLSGLQPGSTYHYRLTATSVDGTSYGADEAFTTAVFPSVLATPPAPLAFVAVPAIAFPTGSEANTSKPAKPKTRVKTRRKRKKHVRAGAGQLGKGKSKSARPKRRR